jgi:anti-sigma B factor antagonist
MNARHSAWAEDVWVVEARGRIDAGLAPELEEQLRMLLAAGHNCLVVDFQRVSYISSSGLKTLLVALRLARSHNGAVKLCCMNDRVHDVFTLSGFHKVFEIYASERDASAAFPHSKAG